MSNLVEKTCIKCGLLKEIFEFCKAKRGKYGRGGKCKLCVNQYNEEYCENNKVKLKKKRKIYNKQNKKRFEDRNKKLREKNKDIKKEYNKIYREENREKIREQKKKYANNNRDKINKYFRSYTKNNINAKIAGLTRTRIRKALKLNNAIKSNSSIKLLGCSIEFLRQYIESKFTKGMSWENHGLYGWHIDHIKPCSSFNLSDSEQQKLCFNYTNLQPLWGTKEIAIQHGESEDYIGNLEKGRIGLN